VSWERKEFALLKERLEQRIKELYAELVQANIYVNLINKEKDDHYINCEKRSCCAPNHMRDFSF
jgi:hypothetical protein